MVRPGDCTAFEATFEFVRANHDRYPVGVMCRLLEVSRSGFYAWDERPLSDRARKDVELTALIHHIHEHSYDGTYGAPRIHRELRDTYGVACRTQACGTSDAAGWTQGCEKAPIPVHDPQRNT